MKAFYDVLEIPKTATQKEIRKAFLKLAMLNHPDRNKGSKESTLKFIKIRVAYEALKSSDNLKPVDEVLKRARRRYSKREYHIFTETAQSTFDMPLNNMMWEMATEDTFIMDQVFPKKVEIS